jgi:hypothetical protein
MPNYGPDSSADVLIEFMLGLVTGGFQAAHVLRPSARYPVVGSG